MCAFNAALNFGKDMIELGVSTLGTLVEIQLADITTFCERQSDTADRTGDVHDVAAFIALQRDYRDAFWTDRGKALTATTGALQVASRRAAKRWAEFVGGTPSKPEPVAIEPTTRAHAEVEPGRALVPQASLPPPARRAAADGSSKVGAKRRIKTAKDPSTRFGAEHAEGQ